MAKPGNQSGTEWQLMKNKFGGLEYMDDYKIKFQKEGIVEINNFLPSSFADELYQELNNFVPWSFSYLGINGLKTISLTTWKNLSEAKRLIIENEIREKEKDGFQFRFCSFPISSGLQVPEGVLSCLKKCMTEVFNSSFTGFMAKLCRDSKIRKHNLLASYYPKTGFLMAHDDALPAVDRRCAFVLQLTKDWHLDWGGHLEFLRDDKSVCRQITPTFNTLIVFRTPQLHQVSKVSGSCTGKRLALHGWCF